MHTCIHTYRQSYIHTYIQRERGNRYTYIHTYRHTYIHAYTERYREI